MAGKLSPHVAAMRMARVNKVAKQWAVLNGGAMHGAAYGWLCVSLFDSV